VINLIKKYVIVKKVIFILSYSFYSDSFFLVRHFISILIPPKDKNNCLINNCSIVFKGKKLKKLVKYYFRGGYFFFLRKGWLLIIY